MFSKNEGLFSSLPSRTSFWLGFFGGLLMILAIGFIVMVIVYFSSDGITLNNRNKLANNQPTVNTNNQAANNGNEVNLRSILKSEAVRGSKDAKVQIIEFSDFQCPYCSDMHNTLQQALSEYGEDIAWVHRHFPLESLHPQARRAAEASECANEQGKFWDFADSMFVNQPSISQGDNFFKSIAKNLNLDETKFVKCLEDGKYANKVATDAQEGMSNGVSGTPATFINGKLLKGAVDFNTIKQVVDNILQN